MRDKRLVINCDLGEWETPEVATSLIQALSGVGMVNIACGVHAGGVDMIKHCLDRCRVESVPAGAHPGLAGEGGRGELRLTPGELDAVLEEQVNLFTQHCEAAGVACHHIKLHGSLYHAVEADEDLARAYLKFVRSLDPVPAVVGLAGGRVVAIAAEAGVEVWPELFTDRAYRRDGGLCSRSEPDSVLEEPSVVVERLHRWLADGRIAAGDGTPVRVEARTWCVHGDTPGALAMIRALRELIEVANLRTG